MSEARTCSLGCISIFLLRELACTCGPEGYAGQIVREMVDKDTLAFGAASWAWGDMPCKNSIISKPRQFGGHGLTTSRSAIEEEEEVEEE